MQAGHFSPDTQHTAVGTSTFQRMKTVSGAAYFETGTGQPLVLIHGVGMRLEAWAPQIAFFAKSHRVIAVDMPGHGESEKLAAGSRVKEFVTWFERFLNDMVLDKVSLAGHSMGAMISGGAVATYPDRIHRVAYLNGVSRRDPQAKASVRARAASIRSEGVDKEGPLQRWFGDDAESVHARELTRQWLGAVDADGYEVAYSAFAGGDETYADCWPSVQCPALFLTGSDDPNSTPEMARRMAELAPKGWARIIKGHRHMVNLTAPDAVNASLAQWLAVEDIPA